MTAPRRGQASAEQSRRVSVDDLRGDSPYSGRIKESVEARMKQVCPDGKLTPEYLALVTE